MRNGDVDDLSCTGRLRRGRPRRVRRALSPVRRRRPTGSRIGSRANRCSRQDVVHDALHGALAGTRGVRPAREARSGRSSCPWCTIERSIRVRREERLRKRTERAANLEPSTVEDPGEDVVDDAFTRDPPPEVRQALATLPHHNDGCSRWRTLQAYTAGPDRRGARHPYRHREDRGPWRPCGSSAEALYRED